MSKKSRKRNRKILGLLAAGLGAAAMMRGRNKGAVSTVGQPVGVDRMSTNQPPIGGTDHIASSPKYIERKTPIRKDNTITRNSGIKLSDSGQKVSAHGVDSSGLSRGERAQAMAANAAKNKAMNYQRSQTFDAKPRFGAYSVPNYNVAGSGIIKQYKSGGRVKGAGKAKRGLGRAFTKGRK